MVGNLVKSKSEESSDFFNMLDIFSTYNYTNFVISEEGFCNLLDRKIYDTRLIGAYVMLQNSAAYNNGLYVIMDVGHFSWKTGIYDSYDLWPIDCVTVMNFGETNKYRDSNVRTWINTTFYNGFSSTFKSHIIKAMYYHYPRPESPADPTYNDIEFYNDDYLFIPSVYEVYKRASIQTRNSIEYNFNTNIANGQLQYNIVQSNIYSAWYGTLTGENNLRFMLKTYNGSYQSYFNREIYGTYSSWTTEEYINKFLYNIEYFKTDYLDSASSFRGYYSSHGNCDIRSNDLGVAPMIRVQ